MNIEKLSDKELKEILKNQLDYALESINADGSIIECQIDRKNKIVSFTFNIIEVEEDDYIGIAGY